MIALKPCKEQCAACKATSWPTAEQVAVKCASISRPSYYSEPFYPHQWVLDAMEQYAAQQVEGLKYQYVQVITEHVDQKMKAERERDTWQDAALRKGEELEEVKRQRDEANALLLECKNHVDSDAVDRAISNHLSQLENEKKDELPR